MRTRRKVFLGLLALPLVATTAATTPVEAATISNAAKQVGAAISKASSSKTKDSGRAPSLPPRRVKDPGSKPRKGANAAAAKAKAVQGKAAQGKSSKAKTVPAKTVPAKAGKAKAEASKSK